MRADSMSRIIGLIGFAIGGFYLEERAPRLIRELSLQSCASGSFPSPERYSGYC